MFNWFGRRENNEASASKNPKVTIGDEIDGLKVIGHFQDDSEYNFKQDGKSDFDVGDKMKKVEAGSFHKNKKVNNTPVGQPQAEISTNSASELEPVRIHGSVIIMNQEFKKNKRSHRVGSIRDVEALEKSFTRLGMTPIVLPDLKHDDIVKEVDALSQRDFSADQLLVFAYMSHCDKNNFVEAADGDNFDLEKIIIKPIMENKKLSGVAKAFITVACREENDSEESDSDDVQKDRRLVIQEKRFDYPKSFISYSTYKGRKTPEGTDYIQNLCKNLDKVNGDTKIHSIFTNRNKLNERLTQVQNNTMGDLSFKELAINGKLMELPDKRSEIE